MVDDDAAPRQALGSFLLGEGYEVIEAEDGVDALKVLGSTPVDLVITDLVMAEVEGLELIRKVRKDHPGIKIVAASGSQLGQVGRYLQMAERLGASHAFTKPYEMPKVLAVVRELVGE